MTKGTGHVALHVRPSGERLPVLVRPDGLLDEYATAYTTVVLRARSGSYHTLAQALYGVLALRRFSASQRIDLEERILTSEFLRLHEWTDFTQEAGAGVAPATLATRMAAALAFITWRIEDRLRRIPDPVLRAHFRKDAEFFLDEAFGQIPANGGECAREPLCRERQQLLAGILHSPAKLQELWPDPFARSRNEALLWWLWLLGHRIGEVLNLRVTDIDLGAMRLKIERRHDSPDDPRRRQPLVKGRGRTLQLPPALLPALSRYLAARAEMPLTHAYLFVAESRGPLSYSTVAKAFARLRELHPSLAPLSPHVLRHTWVAAFRTAARHMGLGEEEAARIEGVAMGWRDPASGRHYAVRQRAEIADEISLRLQREMMGDKGGMT